MTYTPHGIVGVTGRMPIGAAVTMGRKPDGGGFPVEKDFLHILEPHESPGGARLPHPSFGWWNDGGKPAVPGKRSSEREKAQWADWTSKRRTIRGVIAHPRWENLLQQEYSMWRPHSERGIDVHPDTAGAWCHGDGLQAERWTFRKPESPQEQIACPAEECAFRQKCGRKGPECKPTSRFHFRLTFSDQIVSKYNPPTLVAKFVSGGWRTFTALQGLREEFDAAAVELHRMGMLPSANYSPMGIPFALTASEGTSRKDGGRRYPYVNISAEVSAPDFLLAQAQTKQLAGEFVALPGATAEEARLIGGPS